jgi:Tfp pilus assembly protein PilX
MLIKPSSMSLRSPIGKQHGVVLMIALIMLVAMTLAGIALVRSTDTTNIIAGNLAFKQSATSSGDRGTEAAINWLMANNSGTTLQQNDYTNGYSALRASPTGKTWDKFWTDTLAGHAKAVDSSATPTDAAFNSVSYAIERLCNATGDPLSSSGAVDCSIPPVSATSDANSKTAGSQGLVAPSQIYYRITSRIAGPRNTVSYIQTIVAL